MERELSTGGSHGGATTEHQVLPAPPDGLNADPGTAARQHIAAADECLFYSEAETATRLGIHRTTLRALALGGRSPVEPIPVTGHRRIYRRIDVHRLAGLGA
jgi:hypothetical protein